MTMREWRPSNLEGRRDVPEGRGNLHDKVKTWVFLGFFLLLFAAGVCLPKKAFSQEENRYLAQKPEFSVTALLDGKYGKAYEEYLSDQFPMRNSWITGKTGMERALGKQDVNGVYFGKDGYYIEKFDQEDIDTGQMEKNMGYLSDFVKRVSEGEEGRRVHVMPVPSASQILKQKLPAFASPYDQSLIYGRLKDMVGEEVLVNPEPTLKEHSEEDIYYRTDHHWTTLGAYYGYQEWANRAGLKPWPLELFEKKAVSTDFLGTIQSKINISMKPDEILLFLPYRAQNFKVFYDGSSQAFDSLYQMEALEGKDQYKVFLDGNHGWTKIVNQERKEGGEDGRLLIIKDSYAHCFAPFAAGHFSEVHMIDLRYFNADIQTFMDGQGITDILILYQIPGFAKDRNLVKLR